MQKKKRIVAGIEIFLLLLYGVRVYRLNSSVDLPVELKFSMGQVVEFGEDFHTSSESSPKGYSVQVQDASILSAEDFKKKYDSEDTISQSDSIEYYYLVHVSFANQNEIQKDNIGISLMEISLASSNYYAMIDSQAFELVNPKMPGTSFSLRPNSEMEMILTYGIVPAVQTDYEGLLKNPPSLLLTEYPQRKRIELQVDNV